MFTKEAIRTPLGFMLGIILLSATSIASGQFRDGFFKQKKETKLNRSVAPKVFITGTIKVTAIPGKGVDPGMAARLSSMLESKLVGNATRFKPTNTDPDTIILCEITQLDSEEKWETHTSKQPKKTGVKNVWNEKKKKNETKDVYTDVQVNNRYKVVKGSISVSYQVKDARKGNIFDADLLNVAYDENGIVYGERTIARRKEPGLLDNLFSRVGVKKNMFLDGNGAPSQEETKQALIEEVVYQVVSRLAPTAEPVTVLLPRGKCDQASDLGQHGLWQKMLDTLESMETKNQKDESYRLYGIGLAYEAKAYKADTLDQTIDLIVKAQSKYDEAYEKNPGEEYFLEPQARIKEAREQYEKLKLQKPINVATEDGPKGISVTPAGTGNNGGPKGAPSDATLTNEKVIELTRKGLDETLLITTINDAVSVRFDLTANGLSHLLDNGVTNKVIAAMKARQAPSRNKKSSRRKRN